MTYMGRLGALGSLGVRLLAGTFQGPLYMAFSTSYRALSLRAVSYHICFSSFESALQARETILAISVVETLRNFSEGNRQYSSGNRSFQEPEPPVAPKGGWGMNNEYGRKRSFVVGAEKIRRGDCGGTHGRSIQRHNGTARACLSFNQRRRVEMPEVFFRRW